MTDTAIHPSIEPVSNCSDENPWPGLLSFAEADTKYFHGRSTETEELYRLVGRSRLTVVFGRTGLGKTSLLRAGLIPRLRNTPTLPVYIRLDFKDGTVDLVTQTLQAITEAARAANVETPRSSVASTLWEYFHRPDVNFWNADRAVVTPVLVFDQFEEIFTLGHQDESRRNATRRFVEQLADLVEGRVPQRLKDALDDDPDRAADYDFGRHAYKVVVSMREDYLPHLEELRRHMPSVVSNRYRVVEMSGDRALEAVLCSGLVEQATGEKIVQIVASRSRSIAWARGGLDDLEVNPALLSVFCRELNEKRKAREGTEKIDESLLRGGATEILQQFYDRSIVDVPPRVRQFVERRLVLPGGQRDSVAGEVAVEELGGDFLSMQRLVDRGIVLRESRNNVVRFELAHDVLAEIIHQRKPQQPTQSTAPEFVGRRQPLKTAFVILTLAALLASVVGNVIQMNSAVRAEEFWRGRVEAVHNDLNATKSDLNGTTDALKRTERQCKGLPAFNPQEKPAK